MKQVHKIRPDQTRRPPWISPYYFSFTKRVFDLIVASMLLIFSLPLILLLSLIIWLTAGRPVLYAQQRSGQNKKKFTLYKLRTMKKNADALKQQLLTQNQAPDPMFKIHDDPRFVGIGKWLSHTGLDELPQLINVLKGEMSLIGPRPSPVAEAQQIPSNWQWRFAVKPGLVSEWTLAKNRHQGLKRWQRLEKEGLRKASIKKDCLILANLMEKQFLSKLL